MPGPGEQARKPLRTLWDLVGPSSLSGKLPQPVKTVSLGSSRGQSHLSQAATSTEKQSYLLEKAFLTAPSRRVSGARPHRLCQARPSIGPGRAGSEAQPSPLSPGLDPATTSWTLGPEA